MSFPRYPKYKPSGAEWLGEVPEGWEVKRLKHNVRLLTEKTDRREHPVGLENIEGWSGRLIPTETAFEGEGIAFEAGDILFGKLRPYLAKAYLAKSACEAVGDFHVLRPAIGVDGRFTQYQILNREFISIVDGSTFGAKMPRASWEFVGGMKVTLPPLPEQTAIAEFLDRETGKIDELVAEQRRLMELLKEKRQAVISHAVTKGLNPHAPMKPSGIEWLGDVPVGWEVTNIKRVGRIQYGIGEPPKYYDDGTPLIRATNVHAGEIFSEGLVFVDPIEIPEKSIVWLQEGDIIVVRSGAHTGDSAIIPVGYGPCIAGFDMVLKCHSASPAFVQFALLSKYLKDGQIDLQKMRAAQPHLNAEELGSCFFLLPPAKEQDTIVEFLTSELAKFDTLTAEAQRAIDLLQERRTALISAAVTGQIDVRHQPRN